MIMSAIEYGVPVLKHICCVIITVESLKSLHC